MWTAETVVVCALTLLARGVDSFPPIEFVATPPSDVSAQAEGFVRPGDERIYLITSTHAFRSAQNAAYKCGQLQALRKIASVLVHEEWHLENGDDEDGAYAAQLMALLAMNAGPGTPIYQEVRRSRREVVGRQRSRPAAPAETR